MVVRRAAWSGAAWHRRISITAGALCVVLVTTSASAQDAPIEGGVQAEEPVMAAPEEEPPIEGGIQAEEPVMAAPEEEPPIGPGVLYEEPVMAPAPEEAQALPPQPPVLSTDIVVVQNMAENWASYMILDECTAASCGGSASQVSTTTSAERVLSGAGKWLVRNTRTAGKPLVFGDTVKLQHNPDPTYSTPAVFLSSCGVSVCSAPTSAKNATGNSQGTFWTIESASGKAAGDEVLRGDPFHLKEPYGRNPENIYGGLIPNYLDTCGDAACAGTTGGKFGVGTSTATNRDGAGSGTWRFITPESVDPNPPVLAPPPSPTSPGPSVGSGDVVYLQSMYSDPGSYLDVCGTQSCGTASGYEVSTHTSRDRAGQKTGAWQIIKMGGWPAGTAIAVGDNVALRSLYGEPNYLAACGDSSCESTSVRDVSTAFADRYDTNHSLLWTVHAANKTASAEVRYGDPVRLHSFPGGDVDYLDACGTATCAAGTKFGVCTSTEEDRDRTTWWTLVQSGTTAQIPALAQPTTTTTTTSSSCPPLDQARSFLQQLQEALEGSAAPGEIYCQMSDDLVMSSLEDATFKQRVQEHAVARNDAAFNATVEGYFAFIGDARTIETTSCPPIDRKRELLRDIDAAYGETYPDSYLCDRTDQDIEATLSSDTTRQKVESKEQADASFASTAQYFYSLYGAPVVCEPGSLDDRRTRVQEFNAALGGSPYTDAHLCTWSEQQVTEWLEKPELKDRLRALADPQYAGFFRDPGARERSVLTNLTSGVTNAQATTLLTELQNLPFSDAMVLENLEVATPNTNDGEIYAVTGTLSLGTLKTALAESWHPGLRAQSVMLTHAQSVADRFGVQIQDPAPTRISVLVVPTGALLTVSLLVFDGPPVEASVMSPVDTKVRAEQLYTLLNFKLEDGGPSMSVKPMLYGKIKPTPRDPWLRIAPLAGELEIDGSYALSGFLSGACPANTSTAAQCGEVWNAFGLNTLYVDAGAVDGGVHWAGAVPTGIEVGFEAGGVVNAVSGSVRRARLGSGSSEVTVSGVWEVAPVRSTVVVDVEGLEQGIRNEARRRLTSNYATQMVGVSFGDADVFIDRQMGLFSFESLSLTWDATQATATCSVDFTAMGQAQQIHTCPASQHALILALARELLEGTSPQNLLASFIQDPKLVLDVLQNGGQRAIDSVLHTGPNALANVTTLYTDPVAGAEALARSFPGGDLAVNVAGEVADGIKSLFTSEPGTPTTNQAIHMCNGAFDTEARCGFQGILTGVTFDMTAQIQDPPVPEGEFRGGFQCALVDQNGASLSYGSHTEGTVAPALGQTVSGFHQMLPVSPNSGTVRPTCTVWVSPAQQAADHYSGSLNQAIQNAR